MEGKSAAPAVPTLGVGCEMNEDYRHVEAKLPAPVAYDSRESTPPQPETTPIAQASVPYNELFPHLTTS